MSSKASRLSPASQLVLRLPPQSREPPRGPAVAARGAAEPRGQSLNYRLLPGELGRPALFAGHAIQPARGSSHGTFCYERVLRGRRQRRGGE